MIIFEEEFFSCLRRCIINDKIDLISWNVSVISFIPNDFIYEFNDDIILDFSLNCNFFVVREHLIKSKNSCGFDDESEK